MCTIMTKFEKLVTKFKKNPESCSFSKIEKILINIGFEKREGKGSHIRYSLHGDYLTFSLHNGDIKDYQKRKALKKIKKYSIKNEK